MRIEEDSSLNILIDKSKAEKAIKLAENITQKITINIRW
jgi:hypothetical protein